MLNWECLRSVQYGVKLEQDVYRNRTPDFVWMMLFSMAALLVSAAWHAVCRLELAPIERTQLQAAVRALELGWQRAGRRCTVAGRGRHTVSLNR